MMRQVRPLARLRHPTALAAILTALALIALGVSAWFLADTQNHQRRDLRDRYADRTAVAASLIDSLFNVAFSSQRDQAAERYSGDSISRERLDAVVKQGQLAYSMIVDASGRVIASSSNAPPAPDPAVLRTALKGGVGLSAAASGSPPVIQSAIAFRTPSGPRVQVNGSPKQAFVTFISGTLKPLPTLTGSRAFVLDERGGSLGAARQGGRPVPPSPELRRAIARKMQASYTVDGTKIYAASTTIPRTPWKVVLTASERRLYDSVSGFRRWAPWAILVVGALALVAVALLLWRLVKTNEALDTNRHELQERALELERSNADLEQFAYAASHDLSEPLRTVAGFSQLLSSRYGGRLDAEADEFIHHMTAGVNRMQQLIDDLLMYSRVGRAPLHDEAVDLDAVLTEVLDWIQPAIQERGAQVTSDSLPTVRGERGQIAQVLQNLVANAVKFTTPDTTPEVHVSAERDGAQWRIAVRDNGIGVGEDPDVIFKMFGRLHPADAYPGTGIGLALVKRIVENHGGRIWVDPAPGRGSIFSFTLPAAVPSRRPSLEVPA
jgi:signal transduction histidine kinase